jgi:O-antigen ligase
MILERPLLGWGHGAFWLDWAGEGSSYVFTYAGWTPGYAHNGFLDVALHLGLLGLAVLMVAVARVWWSLWRRVANMQDSRWRGSYLWLLALLAFLVLGNLVEGGWADQNYYMWIVFVIAQIHGTPKRSPSPTAQR